MNMGVGLHSKPTGPGRTNEKQQDTHQSPFTDTTSASSGRNKRPSTAPLHNADAVNKNNRLRWHQHQTQQHYRSSHHHQSQRPRTSVSPGSKMNNFHVGSSAGKYPVGLQQGHLSESAGSMSHLKGYVLGKVRDS